MTAVGRVEFYTTTIGGERNNVDIVRYLAPSNAFISFSVESVATAINLLIDTLSPTKVFRPEFLSTWQTRHIDRMTVTILRNIFPNEMTVELNSIIKLPEYIKSQRFLSTQYADMLTDFGTGIYARDTICMAEKKIPSVLLDGGLVTRSFAILSLLPILTMDSFRALYATLFNSTLTGIEQLETLAELLLTNRNRNLASANVFQLNLSDVLLLFDDNNNNDSDSDSDGSEGDSRALTFVRKFNDTLRAIKPFALVLTPQQLVLVNESTTILSQFVCNQNYLSHDFRLLNKLPTGNGQSEDYIIQKYCERKRLQQTNVSIATEERIFKILIRIFFMVRHYLNFQLDPADISFFQKIFDNTVVDTEQNMEILEPAQNTPCRVDVSALAKKSYTIGQLISLFVELDRVASNHVTTSWLCSFINLACSQKMPNIINMMGQFVPLFDRYLIPPINVDSLNNLILFLQGDCNANRDVIEAIKNTRGRLNLGRINNISITRVTKVTEDPLTECIESLVARNTRFRKFNSLNEKQRARVVNLVHPNPKQLIDYVYQIQMDYCNQPNTGNDPCKNTPARDLSGESKYHFSSIDIDNLVPLVSTQTFNENNVNIPSLTLFNSLLDKSTLFLELVNRLNYDVPGVVATLQYK